MSETIGILNDTRPIESIELGWGEYTDYFRVGYADVTLIDVCAEAGPHCDLPWFRVWEGKHLVCKVNALAVSRVEYRRSTDTAKTDAPASAGDTKGGAK